MSGTDVIEMVMRYLDEHDLDGLYQSGDCACDRNDLAPCSDIREDCAAGIRVEFPDMDCDCGEGCSWHIMSQAVADKHGYKRSRVARPYEHSPCIPTEGSK